MKDNLKKGFWELSHRLEEKAVTKVSNMLAPFDEPIKLLYECGVEVVTLNSRREVAKEIDLQVAALFLKRCLTDLRAIWRLLLMGYTSQAGTLAAATFEYALIVSAIVGNVERSHELLELSDKEEGKLWSVWKLCGFEAEHEKEEKINLDSINLKERQKELYNSYQWLCGVKHPTLASARHDAGATSINGTSYVVMAAPDIGILDLWKKFEILSLVITRIYSAIKRYSKNMAFESDDDNVRRWQSRFDTVVELSLKAYTPTY